MANIQAYPTGTPKVDDLLLGTSVPLPNTDAKPTTNNFKVSDISSLTNIGYTVYTALITQAGTAAPVATVLQNTTGGTIAWTRNSTGRYVATISGANFTANKTAVIVTSGGNSDKFLKPVVGSTSTIDIYNIDTGNSAVSDIISATTTVEIRIYS